MTQQITKLTEQLKQQTYKAEYLEKELVRVKLQGEQRLSEIDKLYKENDKYRADLSFISLKYDFDQIDRTRQSVEDFLEWSNNALELFPELTKRAEQFFSCGICNGLADNITQIVPCGHVFCEKCEQN